MKRIVFFAAIIGLIFILRFSSTVVTVVFSWITMAALEPTQMLRPLDIIFVDAPLVQHDQDSA